MPPLRPRLARAADGHPYLRVVQDALFQCAEAGQAAGGRMSPERGGNLELAAWTLLAGLFWLAVFGALALVFHR